MRRTAFAIGFLLALGVGLVATAEARDVEITVPVRVVSLHPTVTLGRVECAAYLSGRVLEHAYTDFTLVNGGFSGDVTVRLMIGPTFLPDVHSWSCELRFVRPYEGPAHGLSLEGGRLFHEEFRRAPGSEFRYQVEGTL